MKERFQRTELLLGDQNHQKLRDAHVTVVGLGAVGYHTAEALVRCGIRNIRLADFDVIRESNFNRQLLALESTLGISKVNAAQSRLLGINRELNVDVFETFFHEDTFPKVFGNPTDIVVDAIDSFTPKVKLLEMLVKQNIPVISSMGAAQRLDPFSIRVGDLAETDICPLAARVRKFLRRRGIHRGIPCVYSLEPPIRLVNTDNTNEKEEKEYLERGRKRTPMGSISYITGIFGYIAASEVIKHLLDN